MLYNPTKGYILEFFSIRDFLILLEALLKNIHP